MGEAPQAAHLVREHLRLPSLEPVRADYDDAAPREPALPPGAPELPQRLPDPGAAVPVEHLLGRPREGCVGIGATQRPGDAGEAGREAERLDAGTAPRRGVGELE